MTRARLTLLLLGVLYVLSPVDLVPESALLLLGATPMSMTIDRPGRDAMLAVEAYRLGWRQLVHYNSRGTRFHGVGFGPSTDGLRIELYDNPGDYLGYTHPP